MFMGNQGAPVAAPIGPLNGPAVPQTVSFRIPYPWEENVPKFITDNYEDLLSFVEHVEEILRLGNVTDNAKKKEYFTSLLPYNRRRQWRTLDLYKSGSFNEFLNEIYKDYPEVQLERSGALERLNEICEEYKGVDRTKEGPLKRFGVEFEAEVNKLERPPALIVNTKAVSKYLQTLEPSFARDLWSMVQTSLLLKGGIWGFKTLANNGIDVETRKSDPIQLKDLVELAGTMAQTDVQALFTSQPFGTKPVNRNQLDALQNKQKIDQLKQDIGQLKADKTVSWEINSPRSFEPTTCKGLKGPKQLKRPRETNQKLTGLM
ncbi:hypothetical protein B0H15DRAFT_807386 [Mycena belliarum]|uniref:Uncharacterized protein n=1 Tax=Mycena belliarum TaxID=1033014 RepID=A0AAD6XDT0_9AGAR|nr:hypothetical protein B0H15DRAFT_807386 [Mycena belliae]